MSNDAIFDVIISICDNEKIWQEYTTKPWCKTSAVASIFSYDYSRCDKITNAMENINNFNVFTSEGGILAAYKELEQELKNICMCDICYVIDY